MDNRIQVTSSVSNGEDHDVPIDLGIIQRVSIADLDVTTFCDKYLLPNRPVLITELVSQWGAFQQWDSLDAFLALYGDRKAPNDGCDENISCREEERCRTVRQCLENETSAIYVKDWHLQKELETEERLGETDRTSPSARSRPQEHDEHLSTKALYADLLPAFLGGSPVFDWLNHSMIEEEDYRFVYVGRKGTCTNMHFDVACSYSWSANICGYKRWRLFRDTDLERLLDEKRNIKDLDFKNPDAWEEVQVDGGEKGDPSRRILRSSYCDSQLPVSDQETPKTPLYCIEIIQKPGELLFVPACWAHMVENMTDAISINHNWLNAASLRYLYPFLLEERRNLIKEMDSWNVGQSDKKIVDLQADAADVSGSGGAGRNDSIDPEMLEALLQMNAACNFGLLWKLLVVGKNVLSTTTDESLMPSRIREWFKRQIGDVEEQEEARLASKKWDCEDET
ncbi:unnamed protein product [Amoebophrya sp. A25]|nr:unnamed protein product [Amoebophrya sp. A25]|eukprot:GSA25T00009137001.1